jgi:hypothetical protein
VTGTNCDLFTHKSSRSYLNHLVYASAVIIEFLLISLHNLYLYFTLWLLHSSCCLPFLFSMTKITVCRVSFRSTMHLCHTLLLSVHANSQLLLHSTISATYLPVLLTYQQAIPLTTAESQSLPPCMTTELSFLAGDIENSLSVMITVIQQSNNRYFHKNRLLFNKASIMSCLHSDSGSGTPFRYPRRRSDIMCIVL